MTKKEFIKNLECVSDEAIICVLAQGVYVAITSIEHFENEEYVSKEDSVQRGEIVVV